MITDFLILLYHTFLYFSIFASATQVFAFGEYAHSLRLVSELPDLREGHVNWTPRRFACGAQFKSGSASKPQRKHPLKEGCCHPGIRAAREYITPFTMPRERASDRKADM